MDGIIAKIMEEERLEQMEKMKKRNESVDMMRQVQRRSAYGVHRALSLECALLNLPSVHGGSGEVEGGRGSPPAGGGRRHQQVPPPPSLPPALHRLSLTFFRYKDSVASRDGAWAERQKALEEEKQRIFDRIAAEVTAKQREQEEFLELQIVLSMQEAEEKKVREDKARAEKRLRDRVEMMAANEHQKVSCVCERAA